MKAPTITFEKDLYPVIKDLLHLKDVHCYYCRKKVTKRNIGGFFGDKEVVCNNTLCLLKLINERRWV